MFVPFNLFNNSMLRLVSVGFPDGGGVFQRLLIDRKNHPDATAYQRFCLE